MKKLFALAFIVAFIILSTSLVFASSKATEINGHDEEVATEHVEEGYEEEHHGTPIAYYVQWLFVFAVLGTALQYVVKFRKHGKKSAGKRLSMAYAVVVMAFLVFFLGYAMLDYHEPLLLGFLRLLLLFISGALVTFYGVLGRHDEAHH